MTTASHAGSLRSVIMAIGLLPLVGSPAQAEIFGFGYNTLGTEITSGLAKYIFLNDNDATTLTFKTTTKGPVEISFSAVCRFETLLANSAAASVDIDIRIDGRTVPVHGNGLDANYFCQKPAGLSTPETEMINSTSVIYPALKAGTHKLRIRMKGVFVSTNYAVSIFNSTVIVKR